MSQALTIGELYRLLEQPHLLDQRPHGHTAHAGAAWAWTGTPASTPARVPQPPSALPRVWSTARELPTTISSTTHEIPLTPPPLPSPLPIAPAPERREVRMAPDLLHAMTAAARATGRHESEVWAEAAREWLARHTPDDDPPPPPGASAHAPIMRATRDRCWGAIDVLLGDLRHPRGTYEIAATGDIDPAA